MRCPEESKSSGVIAVFGKHYDFIVMFLIVFLFFKFRTVFQAVVGNNDDDPVLIMRDRMKDVQKLVFRVFVKTGVGLIQEEQARLFDICLGSRQSFLFTAAEFADELVLFMLKRKDF